MALSLFQTRLSFTLNPAKESRELSLSRFVCNTESGFWISEDFMQKLQMAVTHCSNVHEKITHFSDYMIIFFSPLVLHQIWGSQPNVSLSLLTLVLQNKEHTLRCILMVFHFFPSRLASGIGWKVYKSRRSRDNIQQGWFFSFITILLILPCKSLQ